ncbi:MAG: FG-GAP repeat domain-containing protein, partial [Cytophagales bacterium]
MRLAAFFALPLFLLVCQPPAPSGAKLFTRLSSSHSNIHFQNIIQEDEQINILTYEYTYNGGGVAAADFNNDGLCDLYFVGNTVDNKLYLNTGNLRFCDATDSSKSAGRKLWKTGVAVVDINSDGWLDLYLSYSGPVA